MRVLHSPIEIAGQMGILCKALRTLDVDCTAYNTFHTYLGYRDHIFNVDPYELEWIMQDAIRYFDCFHFHYGRTLAEEYADLSELQRLGKLMVMHHWGNDVRVRHLAAEHNPYVYTGDSPPPETVHERLAILSRYIEHAIVQDYEVYPYVAPYYKHVHVIPIAFDVHAVTPCFPSTAESVPLVIHAPTNPQFKGTRFIEDAIARLRDEGLQFRYRRVERMANKEALALYRSADIIVDQVLCGSYGLFAVEAMSLGKPVVGYIRPDLQTKFPEVPPIISANPDQLYSALKLLIKNPVLRRDVGERGRRYAETYHAANIVAAKLVELYRQLGVRGPSGRS